MTLPAARVSDIHACPMVTGLVPHGGGPILPPGCPTVLIGGVFAARMGDMVTCVGPIDAIAIGSPTVLIGGLMAARMTDMTAHGGQIVLGAFNVLIGGAAAGPGGLPVSRASDDTLHVGSTIVIEGSPEFQAQVINRLALIGSTPAGQQLLTNIEASGKTMTIEEFTGPNSSGSPDSFEDATAAGRPVFDGAGNPINTWLGLGSQATGTGNGTDTTVQFNPNLTLPNSSDPARPMPNDAVLFHEMNHGSHQMNGTHDGSPVPGWTTQEEQNTISTGHPSEAEYLRERGYPWQRTNHDLGWAPNP